MVCSGHCFDSTGVEVPASFHEPIEESPQTSTSRLNELYMYTPLKSWQTRILRIHASEVSHQLSADLLVAAICDTEDLLIESTGAKVAYTALSYSWGRPALGEALICNETNMPVSRSNAAALIALRSHTEPTYVWIDAICINQEDDLEKSAQVARMLSIYRKARYVTVWIGESDTDSRLAFACIEGLSKLREAVFNFDNTTHASSCCDQLRSIYHALRSLYDRPWLQRTWIRQEIYGARRLTILCGMQQISWDGFVKAADVMKAMRALAKHAESFSDPREAHYSRLLNEAMRNATIPPSGVKPPRDLAEVLLEAQYFEALDPRDTFYAVLGMCNVVAFSKAKDQLPQDSKGAVLVDYEKPLVEVYRDATSCILQRKGGPDKLADLWHSYRRGSLHVEGLHIERLRSERPHRLPYWAVDWRSGTFKDDHREILRLYVQSNDLRTPLRQTPGEFDEQSSVANEAADITRAWYWPEPLESDANVIRVRARVLNYVAYLTDFTCEPGLFVKDKHERLGSTGWAIHSKRMLRDPLVGHAILYPNSEWERFSPETHAWRLAVLGVGNDSQLCLMPSTTQKGDLIIAMAPSLLAIAISPKQSDRTVRGLIPQDDPYEGITREPLKMHRSRRVTKALFEKSVLILLPCTMAFIVSFVVVNRYGGKSYDSIIIACCYGLLLSIVLLGYLTRLHLHALQPVDGLGLRHMLGEICLVVQVLIFLLVSLALGTEPIVTSAITPLVAGVFVFGELWRAYRQVNFHMEMASRRKDVFETLDSITETLGCDFDFHGPVLASYYNRRPLPGRHWALRTSLYVSFLLTLSIDTRSQERRRLKASYLEKKNLIEEEFTQKSKGGYSWDRPIQEFRLH
jgi:hypothetical protein